MGGKLLASAAHTETRADVQAKPKRDGPTSHGEQRTGPRRWATIARRVAGQIGDDHVTLASAGIAFYTLLALFPGIIALVTTYALVTDPAQVRRQVDPVVELLPPDAASLLVRQLTTTVESDPGGLTLGLVASLLAAVWAATGGTNALITGLNMVYDVKETRSFLRLRALAIGLTIGAMLSLVVAVTLVAAFPVALRWLGLDPVAEAGAQIARWLLLVALVGLGLGVVYRWAPDRGGRQTGGRRWLTPGVVVALVVWLAASAGFSGYVSHFGSYDKTYGSLAAVVVLLLWLFLSAFAILLGAEVDAVAEADAAGRDGTRNAGVYATSTAGTHELTTLEGAKMSTVIESVEVAVPVRTAYNQWTQFEEFPRFMEGVQEVRQLDDTHLHWVIDIAGVHREFDAEITEQLPDNRVAWRSVGGPRHAGIVTFHQLDADHSRVTAEMDIDPEGFVENVADKVGVIDRRVKGDLKRFRDFIEDRGYETGAWRGEVGRPEF